MRLPRVSINPTSRRAVVLHTLYLLLLPLLVVGSALRFPTMGYVLVLLSKWRMLAVRPRYWLANVRANMTDLIVGLSVVSFMNNTSRVSTMLLWGGLYALWLIVLKPRSDTISMNLQAIAGQGMGLVALYANHNDWPRLGLVALVWLICFSSARHFLSAFEGTQERVVAHIWALFAAEMALVLMRWQIFYISAIPQLAVVLSIIGYAVGVGYYIHRVHGLSSTLGSQLMVFCVISLLLVIVLSNWQAKTL